MKIPTIAGFLLLLSLGGEFSLVHGAEAAVTPQVGNLREFDRWDFHGNATFSARGLWTGLNTTFDFPELLHPLAPREVFLAAIESHLRLGYQHCGFPNAQVAASYDANADRVSVLIQEGARYLSGPVEVIGAQKMPMERIVKSLTETNASTGALPLPFQFLDNAPANRSAATGTNNSNIWSEGQPAQFDNLSLQSLCDRVKNTLAECGFYRSRFSLQVVTNAATRTATLQVKIAEEGPPATIDQIEVVGNKKNSREALLTYLDLKPGMKYTSDLAASINDRLYHSARFLTNSVLASAPDDAGRLKLTINVLENNDSPPLTEKFKPTEETLLKAREWLAQLGNTRDEAVISVSGYSEAALTLQCILAPHRGLLVLENETVSGTNRLRHALVASSSEIALYVPRLQQKYLTRFSTEQFKSYITVETSAPGADGNTANLTIGAGFESLDERTNMPPYALSMSLAPAAFVRLADPKKRTSWFADNELICSNANSVLKLDARTGRLIGFTFKSGESSHAGLDLHFEPEAFESACSQIEQAGAGFTNVCRTNAPFSSAIGFLGSELVQLPMVESYLNAILPKATGAQIPALLRQLGNEDLFEALTIFKELEETTNATAEGFQIPQQPKAQPDHDGFMQTELAAISQGVLVFGDKIFPPRSWPEILLRDSALLFRGQTTYLPADMTEISASPETGPIGCLASARLLKAVEPFTAKKIAQRGLQQISMDAFRRDYQVLLDEHYLAGQFAAQVATTLSHFNESQLGVLTMVMSKAQVKFIQDCAQQVRTAKPGQPLVETIAPALDVYWNTELKQKIADQLKQIARE